MYTTGFFIIRFFFKYKFALPKHVTTVAYGKTKIISKQMKYVSASNRSVHIYIREPLSGEFIQIANLIHLLFTIRGHIVQYLYICIRDEHCVIRRYQFVRWIANKNLLFLNCVICSVLLLEWIYFSFLFFYFFFVDVYKKLFIYECTCSNEFFKLARYIYQEWNRYDESVIGRQTTTEKEMV